MQKWRDLALRRRSSTVSRNYSCRNGHTGQASVHSDGKRCFLRRQSIAMTMLDLRIQQKNISESRVCWLPSRQQSLVLLERLHAPMPAITSCKDCSELSFGCRSFFFKTNTLCLWVQHIHPLWLLAFCASVQSLLLHEVQDLSCLQDAREVRVNYVQAKMCHFPSDNNILSIWFINKDVVRAG